VLALPAIPLTMTAGAIFGVPAGTLMVTISATLAATIAFLIARYVARDRVRGVGWGWGVTARRGAGARREGQAWACRGGEVHPGTRLLACSTPCLPNPPNSNPPYPPTPQILAIAQRNRRFAAVDRAISQNGLKFVTLLRLSPLLPLALSNYIYGLTSVDLGSYILGSCIGMLPGTYAYVTAGHVGKAVLLEGHGEAALGVAPWQVALGLTASLVAITVIGQLAKRAIEEADAEAAAAGGGSTGGAAAADAPQQRAAEAAPPAQQLPAGWLPVTESA
jgi:uncharacterized membrane protein YdjX (TVP38/TMEM64 family)